MENVVAECAQQILDVTPIVMRAIRGQMRSRRVTGLSVTHFRALVFLDRRPGSTLSALAEHLGLSPATVSKMVEKLVAAGLVRREASPDDRRRTPLCLTARGQASMEAARRGTLLWLSSQVSGLGPIQRDTVTRAMGSLRQLFGDYQTEAAS